MKFHENPSNGSPVVPCGRADRHDEELIVAFRNFTKSASKWNEIKENGRKNTEVKTMITQRKKGTEK